MSSTSLPILDPITRLHRRAKEADRCAYVRANTRLRVAAIGRVLSQFEQGQANLRLCSSCTNHSHKSKHIEGISL